MKVKLVRPFVMAGIVVIFCLVSLIFVRQLSQAQEPSITITKVLNRPSNVVRVGDILTFTITVSNTSGFTLTHVELDDTYDSDVMDFMDATPRPDSSGGGIVVWNNAAILDNPSGLLPGQTQTLMLTFRVRRPRTTTVNRVQGRDVIFDMNQSGTANDGQADSEAAVPAHAPVEKRLVPPGTVPQAGMPLTFTHVITNDSGAILTQLPMTDTYDPAFLEFNFAVPPPDSTVPTGTLVWNNLGPMAPDTSVVVTTVFTAKAGVLGTSNRVSTAGGVDEFGNNVAPGAAEVPITIIEEQPPAKKATREHDDNDNDDDEEAVAPAPTSLATPAALSTATPATTAATGPQGPRYLPETGQSRAGSWLILLAGFVFVTIGWYFKQRKILKG